MGVGRDEELKKWGGVAGYIHTTRKTGDIKIHAMQPAPALSNRSREYGTRRP